MESCTRPDRRNFNPSKRIGLRAVRSPEVHARVQMLCKVPAPFSDVQCPVCGQGFMVYWTRERASEREHQRLELQTGLRAQHSASDTPDTHAPTFELPDSPAALPERFHELLPATAIPLYS